MSISCWDTMAFDTEGQPSDGTLTVPSGASVEIYKNWLYVRHPKMWIKENGYDKSVIAEIHHGEVQVARFEIKAAKHDKQNATFFYVEHAEYPEDGETIVHYMCGMAAYGYKSNLDWLKENHPEAYARIDPKYFSDPYRMYEFCKSEGTWGFSFTRDLPNDDYEDTEIDIDAPEPDLEELWTGITLETAEAFFKWLEEVAAKVYWEKIDKTKAIRFSQGDAFFGDPQATPVGEAKHNMFGQFLDQWKKGEDSE